MDLKYIRDHDILEKYVLGRLTEKQKSEFEHFLETSESGRELEEMRMLIAGVRSTGKQEMKKEIRNQVEQIRHPRTDWTIIYKAAAILFFVVILPSIIYLQFFDKTTLSEHSFKSQPLYPATESKETKNKVKENSPVSPAEIGTGTNDVLDEAPVPAKEEAPKAAAVSSSAQERIPERQGLLQNADKKSARRQEEQLSSAVGAAGIKQSSATTADDFSDQAFESEKSLSKSDIKSRSVGEEQSDAGLSLESVTFQPASKAEAAPDLQRTLTFHKGDSTFILNLLPTEKDRQNYPQKFTVSDFNIVNKTVKMNIMVTPYIYSLKEADIQLESTPVNIIIIFAKKDRYKIDIISNTSKAVKE